MFSIIYFWISLKKTLRITALAYGAERALCLVENHQCHMIRLKPRNNKRFFFPGRYTGVYISLRCLLTEQPNVYRADVTRHLVEIHHPIAETSDFSDFFWGRSYLIEISNATIAQISRREAS